MDKKNKAGTLLLILAICCLIYMPEASGNVLKRKRLSGDWKQTRPRIEACGIFLEAIYTGELASNVSGGIKKETEYLDNIDILFATDLEKLIGWKGATLFVYGLGNHGGSPSQHAGDAQTVSNIDATDAWKIYEAWLEQVVFQDRLSVLVGLYDLNSEFDVIESAGLFLNSSHGIGADYAQSGENGPSIFPTTSLAARVKVRPFKHFYIQAAALDGIPGYPDVAHGTHVHLGDGDGTLLTLETAWFSGICSEKNPYIIKAALGAWYYTGTFDDLFLIDSTGQPKKRSGNHGVYFLLDQTLYYEKKDPDQKLTAFFRYGIAESNVNRFNYYIGGGLTYTGLIPNRDADQLGLAIASAHNGGKYQRAQRQAATPVKNSETVVELTYRIQATPWLSLQPDIQYVFNPDTDRTLDNALVTFIRFEVIF